MAVCLYFVVPCYNDEDTLPKTVPVLAEKLRALTAAETISKSSRLLLVNDGSCDNTWQTILELKQNTEEIVAVNLAENVGEQNALLAGMNVAIRQADCVITMDSDLQDDIHCVDEMLAKYRKGCEVVCGVRKSRRNDSFSARFSSALFYGVMSLAGTGLIAQHSNYRLMSAKAVALLSGEVQQNAFFLPCVVSNIDAQSAVVYYERFARAAGESSYNFKKRFRLAADALLAHSHFLSTVFGVLAALCTAAADGVAAYFIIHWRAAHTFSYGWCALASGLLTLSVVLLCVFAGALRREKNAAAVRNTPLYQIAEIVR